ncbi:hypothetical protein [Kangiella sp. M94]
MKVSRILHYPIYIAALFLIGCETVRLPDGGEYSPPTIKVSMPGTDLSAAYGTTVNVDYLREDETAVFRGVNPNTRFTFLATAEDLQSGVKNVSVQFRVKFKCQVRSYNPDGSEKEYGFSELGENLDRSIPLPGSGDEVPKVKVVSTTAVLKKANEICSRLGGVGGTMYAKVTASATNYFNLSSSKQYDLTFRF